MIEMDVIYKVDAMYVYSNTMFSVDKPKHKMHYHRSNSHTYSIEICRFADSKSVITIFRMRK